MDKDFRPDWKDALGGARFGVRELREHWYYHEKEPKFDGVIRPVARQIKYIWILDVEPICEPRPSGQNPEQ